MPDAFYMLSKMGLQTDQYLKFPASHKWSRDDDDILWRYVCDDATPQGPLSFTLKGRKKVDMMLATGLFFTVNERTRELIEDSKFTGAKFFPLRVPKLGAKVWGLTCCGRLPAPRREGIETYFKPALKKWDGSDFFTVDTTHCKCITARVKKAFEEAKITGVWFTKLDK